MLTMIPIDTQFYRQRMRDMLEYFDPNADSMLLCHVEYLSNMLWWYSKCLGEHVTEKQNKMTADYYRRMEKAGVCAVCPYCCYARKGEHCDPYCQKTDQDIPGKVTDHRPVWCPLENKGE